MEIKTCPFCGSENIILDGDHYVCQNKDCERYIYEDTPKLEDLRHKISAMISSVCGDEENPFVFAEPIVIGEEEAQGLSDAEKPKVVSMFHDYEGIVWFNLEHYDEPIEFDDLTLADIKAIWDGINNFAI